MKSKLTIIVLATLLGKVAFAQEPADSINVAQDTATASLAKADTATPETVKADTASGTLTLSLKEAQDYAVEHNFTMQNASLDVKKAEAAKWQSLATLLPQFSASLDYANMCGYKMDFSGMSIAMNPYVTISAQAAIALSGAQVIGLQISKMSLKMSEISEKKSEQDIRNQVKSLYYSALVMEETVELLDKNLENMQTLLESTNQAVNVGVSEQIDADKLQVQVLTMQTSINSTKRSLEMVYNAIILQLGADVNTKIKLTQSIDDLLNVDVAMKLLSEDFDINNNYDYQMLEQTADIYKKQVALAKWNFAPTLSAYYQYSKKEYIGDAGFDMTPPNMIGASLSIPIASSGNRYFKHKEAKISYNEQMNTIESTKNALLVQHNQLRYNLASAFESYEAQRQNTEVTQRVFDKTTEKFSQGVASSLEVTNAGTNLISAQSSYVQALMELVTAQIELEKLLNNDNK